MQPLSDLLPLGGAQVFELFLQLAVSLLVKNVIGILLILKTKYCFAAGIGCTLLKETKPLQMERFRQITGIPTPLIVHIISYL